MLKMSDIASHAGVSRTTVSFVLNERYEAVGISEKTRLKVLQAAEELGYRSNELARAMRTGNTKMLGALGGNANEEQVGQMLMGALEAADAHGYMLKLLRLDTFGGSAQQVIRRISEARLMGMIAMHLPDLVLEELHIEASRFGTPLVLLDARCANPDIAQVVSDDESGIAAGVEHLARLGHSKIAYISDDKAALGCARNAAFRAAMARHQLAMPGNYSQEGSFTARDLSLQAARALLSLPAKTRPTAVICSGDLIALATLQVAHELQLRVPQDLSVIGFANLTACEYSIPQLTTIQQPFAQMGRAAVNMLLHAIGVDGNGAGGNAAGGMDSDTACSGVKVLPTQLIERASTAPPQHS